MRYTATIDASGETRTDVLYGRSGSVASLRHPARPRRRRPRRPPLPQRRQDGPPGRGADVLGDRALSRLLPDEGEVLGQRDELRSGARRLLDPMADAREVRGYVVLASAERPRRSGFEGRPRCPRCSLRADGKRSGARIKARVHPPRLHRQVLGVVLVRLDVVTGTRSVTSIPCARRPSTLRGLLVRSATRGTPRSRRIAAATS